MVVNWRVVNRTRRTVFNISLPVGIYLWVIDGALLSVIDWSDSVRIVDAMETVRTIKWLII